MPEVDASGWGSCSTAALELTLTSIAEAQMAWLLANFTSRALLWYSYNVLYNGKTAQDWVPAKMRHLSAHVEFAQQALGGQVALCGQCGHAARAGGCDGLPPLVIMQVTSCKNALHAGAAAIVHLHMANGIS